MKYLGGDCPFSGMVIIFITGAKLIVQEAKFFRANLSVVKILLETENLHGFECRAHFFDLDFFNINTQQYLKKKKKKSQRTKKKTTFKTKYYIPCTAHEGETMKEQSVLDRC